jgi:prophage DNA circulation protein
LGDNYFKARDALLKALDEEGPGELIHPYLGSKFVQVGEYTLSETVDEGRIARFTVQFTIAGVAKFPAENKDPIQGIFDLVNGALDTIEDVVDAAVDVVSFPARVAESAISNVNDALDRVQDIANRVGDVAESVASVGLAIRNTRAEVSQLLKTPGKLANRFRDAFSLLFDSVSNKKTLARSLSSGTSNLVYPEVIGPDTPTVNRIKGNQLALQNMVVETSVCFQARAAIEGNYISSEEAVDIRDLLNLDIENQLNSVSDDNLFQQLKDIQAEINAGLPPLGIGELIKFSAKATLPVLVIANKIFGNIDKEAEIIEHNKIKHPGFVAAETEIEVSSA